MIPSKIGSAQEFGSQKLGSCKALVHGLSGTLIVNFHRMLAPVGAPAEFLCIYTIETPDLPSVQPAMVAAGALTVPSPTMDAPATRVEFFGAALV